MDNEFLNYLLSEIDKNKNRPHWSANEELIDECFPHVLIKYPEAILIKQGINQAIAINKKTKKTLYKQLEEMRETRLKEIKEIEDAIKKIY